MPIPLKKIFYEFRKREEKMPTKNNISVKSLLDEHKHINKRLEWRKHNHGYMFDLNPNSVTISGVDFPGLASLNPEQPCV